MPMNVDETRSVADLAFELDELLPLTGGWHPQQSDKERRLLRDRELTALLWEAYDIAKSIHENGVDFDRSHFFLVDVLTGIFRCDDPRVSTEVPCQTHYESEGYGSDSEEEEEDHEEI
jgi:hypothetical protein